MDRLRDSHPAVALLVLCALAGFARAHTLPDADRMVTLELPVSNVEKLASRVEAALREQGFAKASSMPRMTLDGLTLPPSAAAEEGIILARFEEISGLSVSVHVTTCRATFMMWLPRGANRVRGRRRLHATQAMLVEDLSASDNVPVTVTEGVSVRENPCVPEARSNTSLERMRER